MHKLTPRAHVRVHVRAHVRTCVRACMSMYTCMFARARVRLCKHVCVCSCACLGRDYVHVCLRGHGRTYLHASYLHAGLLMCTYMCVDVCLDMCGDFMYEDMSCVGTRMWACVSTYVWMCACLSTHACLGGTTDGEGAAAGVPFICKHMHTSGHTLAPAQTHVHARTHTHACSREPDCSMHMNFMNTPRTYTCLFAYRLHTFPNADTCV